ncbi:MFS transporter [Fulvivirgaceae bacterium BMA12]|uniref:MFS transporter n=1 Tax=Agaribacillus aureus TaxID=3051825 RepID=A0ABT8KZY0_9BACT|nr:MFS transporter [Fulvivirgaceae bacterium BMA12]
MSQKLKLKLGSALTGWILAAFGFEANMEQRADVFLGIRLMISIIAGAGALLSALFMVFFKLDEAFMAKVTMELR